MIHKTHDRFLPKPSKTVSVFSGESTMFFGVFDGTPKSMVRTWNPCVHHESWHDHVMIMTWCQHDHVSNMTNPWSVFAKTVKNRFGVFRREYHVFWSFWRVPQNHVKFMIMGCASRIHFLITWKSVLNRIRVVHGECCRATIRFSTCFTTLFGP